MASPFLFLLALASGAWLLSVTQAWAIGSRPPRRGRYVLAWAVSTFGLVLLVFLLPEWSRINPVPREVAWAALLLAALTAAGAMLLAGKLGSSAALHRSTVVERGWRLFPIHVLTLAVLGIIDVLLLFAIVLGRIH